MTPEGSDMLTVLVKTKHNKSVKTYVTNYYTVLPFLPYIYNTKTKLLEKLSRKTSLRIL